MDDYWERGQGGEGQPNTTKKLFSYQWARSLLLLLILITSLLPFPHPAQACIGDQFDSVHFNSGQPDFGTPPRRGVMWDERYNRATESGWDSSYGQKIDTELSVDRDDTLKAKKEKRGDSVRERARADEARGAWAAARAEYAGLAERDGWSGDLRDRVAVLDAKTGGAKMPPELLRQYLHAMNLVHTSYATKWTDATAEFEKIEQNGQSGDLRPFALYQVASLYAGWFDYDRAVAGYQSLLKAYPKFPRREEATIMLARCAILPATAKSRRPEIGAQALHQLLTDYPQTRFRKAATGLQARLDLLAGNYGDAVTRYLSLNDTASVEIVLGNMPHARRERVYPQLLCGYLLRLNRAATYYEFAQAVAHIRHTMTLLTPNGAKTFVAALHRSPATLGPPYFYYRLYHCDNTSRDLRHLAALADSLETAPSAMPPLLRVRIAEVFYQSGRMTDALRWAQATTGDTAHPYDRALFVSAAAQHRLHQTAASRATFETLLARCPDSTLRVATRENLAIVEEEQGDLGGALDQYFVLDYKPDIAFFLDARMTTAQVAAYVAAHPRHPQKNLLRYTLGIRSMRDENWDAARRALESVPRKFYVAAYHDLSNLDDPLEDRWSASADEMAQPAPLQTVAALARLQARVNSASTDTARASALFRYAAYYYDHGTLLLYNGALWQARREFNFDFWWNGRHATVEDGRATRRHMYQHETYARTEAICRQIARDYPDTPTAPYALYRAGCCASKLGRFNSWWENDCNLTNHDQEAANCMSRVYRRYPHCPLAGEARKFAGIFQEAANSAAEERRKNPQSHFDSDRYSHNEDL